MFEERSDEFALPARNALRSNAGEETRKGDFKLLETEFVSGVSFCGTFWTSKKCQWIERHSTLENINKIDPEPSSG